MWCDDNVVLSVYRVCLCLYNLCVIGVVNVGGERVLSFVVLVSICVWYTGLGGA